jgi:hypothetical protein
VLVASDEALASLMTRPHAEPSAMGVWQGDQARIVVTRRFVAPVRARRWPTRLPCEMPESRSLGGLAWMLDGAAEAVLARSPLSVEGWHCLPGTGVSEAAKERAARTALAHPRFREAFETYPHHAPEVEPGLCCRSERPLAVILVTVRFVEPHEPSAVGFGVTCEMAVQDPRTAGARWLISLRGDEVLASDGMAASGESCVGLNDPSDYP